MKLKVLFVFLFFITVHSSYAQDEEEVKKDTIQYTEQDIRIDSSFISKKNFNKDQLKEYKDSGDFNYEVADEEPTILDSIWSWIKGLIRDFISLFTDNITPVTGFLVIVLEILPYVLLGIAIILIAKYFLNINTTSLIEKDHANKISFQDDEELIQSDDLSKLLDEAISNKEYRVAIRFYYLLVLQNLTNKGMIQWQQEKTNEDYIRELKNTQLLTNFTKITRLYDFVWYGNFEVNDKDFEASETIFKSLAQKKLG